MDFSNYDSNVCEITEKIIESRGLGEVRKSIGYCRTLIRIGHQKKDIYLLGFGYYYLAAGCFILNDYNAFMKYLTKSIPFQEKTGQWTLLIRSYNMLGVNAINKGNIIMALDHFILALSYGQEHDIEYETGLVCINIGQLYFNMEEYQNAIRYLHWGETFFLNNQDNPFGRKNLLLTYTLIGHCYLQLKELPMAEEVEEKMEHMMQPLNKNHMEVLPMKGFRAQLRHKQGQTKEREVYIKEILKDLRDITSMFEMLEYIFYFGNFLLELKKYQELEEYFELVEAKVEQMKITNMKMEFLHLKIRYYKETQKKEYYTKACAKLYELGEELKEENINTIRRSTQLRFSLEEARNKEAWLQKEKKKFQEKSEKDALTGVANRYKINDYAEEIFRKAFEKQLYLGVEILDIDYFKQYNDTYGHQAGDECLKKIGCLLREKMKEDNDIFCGRYGGDEFVLIYVGKQSEEVIKLTKKLKKDILSLKLIHEKSLIAKYVTISQGICNMIPEERNRVWDFLHSADKALYQVKQKQKNSICLTHRTGNGESDDIMLTDKEDENDI
ncbi:MAG: GGDEF domain-containing protein [Lachnospiraceae bacterium]